MELQKVVEPWASREEKGKKRRSLVEDQVDDTPMAALQASCFVCEYIMLIRTCLSDP